jgi:hypothetical protein
MAPPPTQRPPVFSSASSGAAIASEAKQSIVGAIWRRNRHDSAGFAGAWLLRTEASRIALDCFASFAMTEGYSVRIHLRQPHPFMVRRIIALRRGREGAKYCINVGEGASRAARTFDDESSKC